VSRNTILAIIIACMSAGNALLVPSVADARGRGAVSIGRSHHWGPAGRRAAHSQRNQELSEVDLRDLASSAFLALPLRARRPNLTGKLAAMRAEE
jgi:hypothetical protein